MTAPRVIVFGSLHYDIMVYGPDRPRKGETVTGESWQPKCGGKGGNQAVSSALAGVETVMIGAVADDAFGQALIANLAAAQVDHRLVRICDGVGSGMSVAIFDAGGDYGAVIVSGSNLTLCQADVDAASGCFDEGSVLILQNEVPEDANVAAARAMQAAGGRVILNAAPARALSDDLQGLVDILVVNAIEAEQMSGLPVIASRAGALEAARRLADHFPTVVVTAGGDGLACVSGSDDYVIAAIDVELVSTHGAGDAFTGVLAAEIALGSTLLDALNGANRAAARLVGMQR
ncbi:MAG: ribokinase [Rhizobium sp.]|nr:ribokinase [Rhizobium sp.]